MGLRKDGFTSIGAGWWGGSYKMPTLVGTRKKIRRQFVCFGA